MIQEYLYQLKILEHKKHQRRPNEFWVTDLVRCPLKRDFESKYPELALQDCFNPRYILGDLAHKGLYQSILEIMAKIGLVIGTTVRFEVEGSKELEVDGQKYIVSGRLDIYIEKDDSKIGIEVKTARGDMNLPLHHHVQQVMLYNWLFDLDKSILFYATPERICEFEIKGKYNDNDVKRLIKEAIEKKNVPKYDWECNYCIFTIVCPKKLTK